MERTPPTTVKPPDRPDVVRTVPIGTAIRIGESTVLALPYAGAVRYLVWSRLDIGIAKPATESENTRETT